MEFYTNTNTSAKSGTKGIYGPITLALENVD